MESQLSFRFDEYSPINIRINKEEQETPVMVLSIGENPSPADEIYMDSAQLDFLITLLSMYKSKVW